MASDTSEIPAGYFTTFSISDSNGLTPRTLDRAQRRNRRVFVCIPCHRRKLKCDKLLPCSRCLAAGIPDECSYQPPPSTKGAANKGKRARSRPGYPERPRHNMKRESSPAASLESPYSSSSLGPGSLTVTTSGTSLASNNGDDDEYERSRSLARPLNGASHWSRIACEFEEATPYLFGTEPRWQQRYRQVRSLECLFARFDHNANFPFGNSGGQPSLSKDQIVHSFPPKHIIDTLVANYLNTFGATHCLFHPSQLRYDTQSSLSDLSSVSDEWLAELCMVLALGAETAPDYLFSGLGQSAAEWAGIFLNAAQVSFGRSSYMAAPSLSTIRTLCMMVIAKLVEASASGGSCGASSGGSGGYAPLVSLMAFTVRTAHSLQLHRPASAGTGVKSPGKSSIGTSPESEMRHRIWVTVQLVDLETALRSGATMHSDAGETASPHSYAAAGKPYGNPDTFHQRLGCKRDGTCRETTCFRSDSLSSPASSPSSFNANLDYGYEHENENSSFYQDKISSFLVLFSSIINTVNSPTKPSPTSGQVAAWDAHVRRCLGDIGALGCNNNEARTASEVYQSTVQFQHLEAVTHRVLLALHHDMFRESFSPLSASAPPTPSPTLQMSQSAVVDSALALLTMQNRWAMSLADPAGRCPSACTNLTTAASVATVDAPFSLLPTIQTTIGFTSLYAKSTAADMMPLSEVAEMMTQPLSSIPLSAGVSPVATNPASHTTTWLLDLCHDDFAAALMYMILALRALHRQYQYQGQDDAGTGSSAGLHKAGGDAAATAVSSSYQVMRDRSYRSVGHFKEFLGIAILFACFRGLHSGDMHSQVVDATNDVEQVVVAGRRYLLWAADSYTPDEALVFSPLVAYGEM